ncbi:MULTISPECIES: amino acid ABC transporter substrate-binding protein [unclassified Beijerinckia]|uniref:amino acid ABC transporter substrate-binding protein n=1 Tax=unclassified Beijerinckia TaxID=2638183 RepID=UPI0008958373|nr:MULTISPECIES: amino acid ABC transporter substrate-binding protein [unclassified Beijerinckia]MDH7797901.1 glutamate/aspartate transport system substrate-binding protein [Beijerinckia sp. GAS462]SED02294.1 amino acid ABC transporter substrate-binding protein, PAAT family [Beijerinckia sp. 28-YEA-48]
MRKVLIAATIAFAAMGAAAQADGTLDKIKSSGIVTQGVRESSGLAYTLGNGVYTGYHYDVCQNIIADIKKKLGLPKLDIRYQPVTSQNRVPLVQNGTVDLECGSTTNNTARARDVDFATTVYIEEIKIAVKASSNIGKLEDLNGKTVATTTGTTSVQTLRKNKRGKDLKFSEVFGKDHADSFLLLQSGRADAFVMDASILAANIARAQNPKDYKILPEVLAVEPIAIMIRKNDPEFKKAVDESIAEQIKAGTIAKLYDKWFMQPIPPNNVTLNMPASDATKEAWANPNDKPTEDYKQPGE